MGPVDWKSFSESHNSRERFRRPRPGNKGTTMKRVCVFCGSKSGGRPVYADATRDFGAALVARGGELVFGAGHVGLMGVLAGAALAAGGRGVRGIPPAPVDPELAHPTPTELRVLRAQ